MNNDRELLELAAMAARIDVIFPRDKEYAPVLRSSLTTTWNPLLDDGDALRLAVRLRLSIDHNHSADQQRWVAADRSGCEGCYSPVSCVEDEFDEVGRQAATRRAIVRASAEIGKRIK